jgi:hypothetical protein
MTFQFPLPQRAAAMDAGSIDGVEGSFNVENSSAALSNTRSNATLPRLVTGLLMLLAVSLELDSNGAES